MFYTKWDANPTSKALSECNVREGEPVSQSLILHFDIPCVSYIQTFSSTEKDGDNVIQSLYVIIV
jgi:hypothetical protein